MAPANRAWIRSKMAAIKKTSGVAFSEEIFLSILICLIAKNKHLVLHTVPEAVPELKSIVEQHSAIVFGLTTATIVCHGHQTRADIIAAITGRHADTTTHAGPSTLSGQYQLPANNYTSGVHNNHHHYHHPHHSSHHNHQQIPSHFYQYSNPADDYTQRSAKIRLEKSRRSTATNHSEASDYSFRPSEHNAAPSIASFRTASERDLDGGSIRRGHLPLEPSEYSRGGDDSSINLRRSESRPKSTGDSMTDHILQGRSRKAMATDPTSIDNLSNRRTHSQYAQALSHLGGTTPSATSGPAPVTPVDFTFPRRRHESTSNTGGYGGTGGEISGITFSGRRIAQAIILDGLENASQEVYAVLLEMIINKEINDKNRYVLPDLIITAIFRSPTVPDNVPKQLLDYFAINGTYQPSIPQQRIQPTPARKHALFRRTEWDELSKRMKAVTISNDMMRYIRDVIVGVRTHEAVQGGLTARAALDLEAIIRSLAAIFQVTFVTPDLVTIAAEKVFAHRLELKSTRRRKILAATTCASSLTVSSTSSSPLPPARTQSNGKTPMRGYQGFQRQQQQGQIKVELCSQGTQGHAQGRRDSTNSDQSSEGGASFVELSDSEDNSSSAGSFVVNDVDEDFELNHGDPDIVDEFADEKTAADVVRDVLRVVYPPI
ncbi:hypothetical protein BC939DRAFT_452484 [Gamsiella multidivaricata]|uniref:uncharacterized protein n=1 Tax=Gamsiella multidivaricata TaxID=101098 RepID=UPI002220B14C|nr:uncharacterized protein BC939DRAFT_452484 [Gamsiella multidivaricata]KAG0368672.1 hypothetical protein BGZ54_001431 [Gamsiella multidivaricata]KAI7822996.1 hypothetical protein BC939DRAFT_452484 [Gamsiella multidivaricata]